MKEHTKGPRWQRNVCGLKHCPSVKLEFVDWGRESGRWGVKRLDIIPSAKKKHRSFSAGEWSPLHVPRTSPWKDKTPLRLKCGEWVAGN